MDQKNLPGAELALRMGADRDFAPSMYRLAMIYRSKGLAEQNAEVIDVLERSFRLGKLFALRDLGTLYLSGQCGPRRPLRGLSLIARCWSGLVWNLV